MPPVSIHPPIILRIRNICSESPFSSRPATARANSTQDLMKSHNCNLTTAANYVKVKKN